MSPRPRSAKKQFLSRTGAPQAPQEAGLGPWVSDSRSPGGTGEGVCGRRGTLWGRGSVFQFLQESHAAARS